jgi:hypothetical protein
MKFMVLLKSDNEIEAGVLPSETLLAEFAQFNGDLVHSGTLLAAEGLRPTADGVRLHLAGANTRTVAGPFGEAREQVAGFWLIDVPSQQDAVDRFSRMPHVQGGHTVVEIRPVMTQDDFGDALTPELRATEDRLRAEGNARLHDEQ